MSVAWCNVQSLPLLFCLWRSLIGFPGTIVDFVATQTFFVFGIEQLSQLVLSGEFLVERPSSVMIKFAMLDIASIIDLHAACCYILNAGYNDQWRFYLVCENSQLLGPASSTASSVSAFQQF